MRFLESFMDGKEGREISKLARESSTFNKAYVFWRDELFERVMKLFIWENTNEVKPKEIEQRLLLLGHCGITKLPNEDELTAMWGTFYGVTKYQDEWSHYTVRCPIYSGQRKIGKDCIVIDNNAIRNPIYPLIHHYAIALGHADVSIVLALVNSRNNTTGVPVVQTESQRQSVANYQGKIFNGQYSVISDPAMLGVEFIGGTNSQNIRDLYEIKERLLRSFYSDIGVRSAFEKKNNAIEAEVEADSSLLLLNLSDMIACREEGADKVNKLFGTNWKVHIAEEIDYSVENQRVQFDTKDDMHIMNNGGDDVANANT